MRRRIITGTIAAIGALILSACATLPGAGAAQLAESPAAAVGDSITGDGGALQATAALASKPAGADLTAAIRWCGSYCNGKIATTEIAGFGRCSTSARILKSEALGPGWPKGEGAPHRVGVADPYMIATVYYSTKCQTMWVKVTNKKAIGRTQCGISVRSLTGNYGFLNGCPKAGTSVTSRMVNAHRPAAGRAGAYVVVYSLDSRNRESALLVQY